MEDDFDVFIDEAELILEMAEKGRDVSSLTKNLVKQAELIDPTTIPTTSIDLVSVSRIIAELGQEKVRETDFSSPIFRNRIRSPNNKTDEPITEFNVNRQILNKRGSFPARILIFILIIFIVCTVYYLNLPPSCPDPIW